MRAANRTVSSIVTMPPYAPYLDEVLDHPAVSGIRLNTVMPLKTADTLDAVLSRLHAAAERRGKDFFIDLKCRQLRVAEACDPPYAAIPLSHAISVRTPVKAYFKDGDVVATVLSVDGNRLIMQEGPQFTLGKGQSVNIIDPSLTIEGYFTETDERYIAAAKKAGVHRYMLSFVERQADIAALKRLDPQAVPVAKIESRKGLAYVHDTYDGTTRLMCARGDLYVEVRKPHEILAAEEEIVRKDKPAIVASRIFPSLAHTLEPSCEDINDVDNLLRMGYRTVMLGDDICQERDSVISALNLFEAIAQKYETYKIIAGIPSVGSAASSRDKGTWIHATPGAMSGPP